MDENMHCSFCWRLRVNHRIDLFDNPSKGFYCCVTKILYNAFQALLPERPVSTVNLTKFPKWLMFVVYEWMSLTPGQLPHMSLKRAGGRRSFCFFASPSAQQDEHEQRQESPDMLSTRPERHYEYSSQPDQMYDKPYEPNGNLSTESIEA